MPKFLLLGQALAEAVHQMINTCGKKIIKKDVHKTTEEIIEQMVKASETGKAPDNMDNNWCHINEVKINQLRLLGLHIFDSVWIIHCQLSEDLNGTKTKDYLHALVFTKFTPNRCDEEMAEIAFNEIIANLSSIVITGPNIAILTAGQLVMGSI